MRCCCQPPIVMIALGFLVSARSGRSLWVGSRRSWVASVVRRRHAVLCPVSPVALQMRHWLEVSPLASLALVVPQMRHFVSASPLLVQAERR